MYIIYDPKTHRELAVVYIHGHRIPGNVYRVRVNKTRSAKMLTARVGSAVDHGSDSYVIRITETGLVVPPMIKKYMRWLSTFTMRTYDEGVVVCGGGKPECTYHNASIVTYIAACLEQNIKIFTQFPMSDDTKFINDYIVDGGKIIVNSYHTHETPTSSLSARRFPWARMPSAYRDINIVFAG